MNLVMKKLNIAPNWQLKLQNKGKNILLIFISISFSVCISGCQLNDFHVTDNVVASNTVNYGQYYLALKNLSANELLEEIKQQKLKKSQGSIEAEVNLLLLHSLPNSPIHNAYSAKSRLNEQLKNHKSYQFSPADQAFIILLKDQLNQQLYLFQQVINQGLEHDAQTAQYQLSKQKQQDEITALELTVTQLTKKITQLKKIEKTISEHGQ